MLNFGQLLLYFGNVVAVGVEELCFVFLYDVLDLVVHVLDGLVQLLVGL